MQGHIAIINTIKKQTQKRIAECPRSSQDLLDAESEYKHIAEQSV